VWRIFLQKKVQYLAGLAQRKILLNEEQAKAVLFSSNNQEACGEEIFFDRQGSMKLLR